MSIFEELDHSKLPPVQIALLTSTLTVSLGIELIIIGQCNK
jgi:hypothetical protein